MKESLSLSVTVSCYSEHCCSLYLLRPYHLCRYDNMLVVWEVSTMPGDQDSPLRALVTHTNAHDAGITTLIVAKDADSSTW